MQKVPIANKKLQNNKIVREMLSGTHRTQTRTVIGYEGKKDNSKREIGDRWTDENGICWEQRDGFRVKHADKADFLKELSELLNMPSHCPKCQKPMGTKLDKKFWHLEHQCFDCQVQFEHGLRITGKFNQYQDEKIKNNKIAYLKDIKSQLEEYIKNDKVQTFVNADGSIEKWTKEHNVIELSKKSLIEIEETILKLEQEFKQKYGEINDAKKYEA